MRLCLTNFKPFIANKKKNLKKMERVLQEENADFFVFGELSLTGYTCRDEYRDLAEEVGVPQYVRVPAVGIRNQFIDGLAQLCVTALAHDKYCGVGGAGTSCFDRIRAA